MDARNRLWRLVRRVLTLFAALVFCVVLAVGVLLGSLWLEHSFWIELPKPTGHSRLVASCLIGLTLRRPMTWLLCREPDASF
jgi:hypothetical protein